MILHKCFICLGPVNGFLGSAFSPCILVLYEKLSQKINVISTYLLVAVMIVSCTLFTLFPPLIETLDFCYYYSQYLPKSQYSSTPCILFPIGTLIIQLT